jgi:3-deoxy-D-manno-octulosonic-acid transferase
MNAALRLGYAAAGRVARALAAVAPEGDSKVLRALRARRGIAERYLSWAARGRDRSRPLLWMHAPSVGEGLQARPVLQLVRAERPDLQVAYTYFSPSAADFAQSLDVDFTDYLPFDADADVSATLDALAPTALVFAKLDVWPTLVRQAAARGARLGIVSATLSATSSRRSGLAAALLRDAYARLDAVGAIDADDAERLVALGVRADAISVTGDTRYDQVWARAAAADPAGPLLLPLRSSRLTLVAGSTWPADERVLLESWRRVRLRHRDARMIIAPHEPTPEHLASLERWAEQHRVVLARLDSALAATADVVLVDRVGVLGDLYAIADVAFIGGGFHAAGLHSVLEPAAFGVPVVFGPRYHGSRDARLLLGAGGAASASSADTLAARLERWIGDAASRVDAGGKARQLVERGLGAARRSYDLVAGLVDSAIAR